MGKYFFISFIIIQALIILPTKLEEDVYERPDRPPDARVRSGETAFKMIWKANQRIPKNLKNQPAIPKDQLSLKKHSPEEFVETAIKTKQDIPFPLYEGDMFLDNRDEEIINLQMGDFYKRSHIPFRRKIWRTRIIPYEIDHPGLRDINKDKLALLIETAITQIQKVSKSCVRFKKKKDGDEQWLRFFKGVGCYTGVGRRYYDNISTGVSIGPGCGQIPVIVHLVLHSLGLSHEHSRPDRNSFLRVHWGNINDANLGYFERHMSFESEVLESAYDFKSILHYNNKAYSSNGKPTLESIHDADQPMGSVTMSKSDVKNLRRLYHCKGSKQDIASETWSTWSQWSPCYQSADEGKCMRSKQRFCAATNAADCPGADKYGVHDIEEQCLSDDSCNEVFDGEWGLWGSWSHCSRSCGSGTYSRTRACDFPPPTNGGKQCIGDKSETRLCRQKRCKPTEYDTTFEEDWGMWKQDAMDDEDWARRSDENAGSDENQIGDHTTGNGWYAFIDASEEPKTTFPRKSRLISKLIPLEMMGNCFTFYYVVSGKNVMHLDIFVRTKDSKKFYSIWERTYHQGKHWLPGAVTLPKLDEPYEVVFEGSVQKRHYALIAIDDIYIDKGACSKGIEDCIDQQGDKCEDWKRHGSCYKNTNWMLRQCCATCSGMATCKDDSDKCNEWSLAGECVSNWNWMWENCCASCKGCLDSMPLCVKWAQNGECIGSNKDWMVQNCKYSCNTCKERQK